MNNFLRMLQITSSIINDITIRTKIKNIFLVTKVKVIYFLSTKHKNKILVKTRNKNNKLKKI